MEIVGNDGAIGPLPLPPGPFQAPLVQANGNPQPADPPRPSIISRRGFGTAGQRISLIANHFKVSIGNPDQTFYQYNVSIISNDKNAVESNGIRRKIIDKLYQTLTSELGGKKFAYDDGSKSLYTVGRLEQDKKYTLVLEESYAYESGIPSSPGCPAEPSSELRRSFVVKISYAAEVHLEPVSLALQGSAVENIQDAQRVLGIVLRQQEASRGCLLVRRSLFHDDSRNFADVGGGELGCRGFHSTFCPTRGGLSLNMDASTTLILNSGTVADVLLSDQDTDDPDSIDWSKAKKILTDEMIKTSHTSMTFNFKGLSEKKCNEQFFPLKVKNIDASNGGENAEITVYDYFTDRYKIKLYYSEKMRCIDVGKPKRPNYLPMELCSFVSLQSHKNALCSLQKPSQRLRVLTDAVRNYNYKDDSILAAFDISIEKQLTQVEGRVLKSPKLKIGRGEDFEPSDGRWNFKSDKKLLEPIKINCWAVVNFSARDASQFSQDLIDCGRSNGMEIKNPYALITEGLRYKIASPVARVLKMFDKVTKHAHNPQFLLCILPEEKNSEIYGCWEKKSLCDFGIATQCVSPSKINNSTQCTFPSRIKVQYITNVLLKINTKLGGINSLLAIECPHSIPLKHNTPTMILGMAVSHGSPGRSDIPSIAAVVGSRSWPHISRYRAAVRTQSSKLDMIETLFKPLANGEDGGIMRELLSDFYQTSKGCRPNRIIVFRNGVGESQFNQVLNNELDQMRKAYQHLDKINVPKFTVIVAQKSHHTKLFQAVGALKKNVPPGTVVDTEIVHPRNYDFYMYAHAGTSGSSRPAHYHVLVDENGFSPDDLQDLIHSLSYVSQRSTTAISIAAPVHYARLAAKRMGQLMKVESEKGVLVPKLPRLHKNVEDSMFFC